jgi:riboflavin synthase
MFTGIVEEVGTVHAVERGEGSSRLTVACSTVRAGTRVGDSVSVNGVCLTASALPGTGFVADLMGETLDRSALGDLVEGSPVNLERALRADGRLGGHLVQGHVDAVGVVVAVTPHADWTTVRVTLPDAAAPYVVEKGSITVDGTSLTVTAVSAPGAPGWFEVGLIPHTLAVTTHGRRSVGDRVNLEVDVIAKYVERMLRAGATTPYSSGD